MNSYEQRHRNAHPDDRVLFSGQKLLRMQKAAYELCWLFNHGYTRQSAIKFVGDHYKLKQRQRVAIGRASCSDDSKNIRKSKCLQLTDIKNRHLIIDGFNLIITLEVAMAGAVLLRCCDGCIRDLASVHGTYRQVRETKAAIEMIGSVLAVFDPASVQWLFDKPVSNSGRLAQMARSIAKNHGWNWQVDLHDNTDQIISASGKIAITSDSVILDTVEHWLNFMDYLFKYHFQNAWLIDFS
ncbi:MAG: DUF434 domain-containing protein [Methylococcales bacterium]|nr:DUF434 domain-containing protein [Methylococcales bacterium]MCK5478359.1 DUF434 domain-containing protein [Methylococcales bacterium]